MFLRKEVSDILLSMKVYKKYKDWKFKNTTFLIITLVLFFMLAKTPFLEVIIDGVGGFGYFSAFFAGIFFVSIFTVAPASVVIYDLAKELNPFYVAIFAGAGAVLGDYLIFRYLKDHVFEELQPLFSKITFKGVFARTFRTPFFAWAIPLAGAAIIASPFPDEAGIVMLGLSDVKKWQFILVTFLLNSVGILLVITLAESF